MNPPNHALRSSPDAGSNKRTSASLLNGLGANVPMPTVSGTTELVESSNTYSPGVTSAIEQKALNLLGSGIPSEQVASALGVTPGRISQLLSNETFAEQVAIIRYESLQKHNVRDGEYDNLEDKLLEKLTKALPLIMRPETILKAIAVVNNAKRRGQNNPDTVVNQNNIVSIILPNVIAAKFAVNIDNQVTKAGDQELVTMQAGSLLKQAEAAAEQKMEELRALAHED